MSATYSLARKKKGDYEKGTGDVTELDPHSNFHAMEVIHWAGLPSAPFPEAQ